MKNIVLVSLFLSLTTLLVACSGGNETSPASEEASVEASAMSEEANVEASAMSEEAKVESEKLEGVIPQAQLKAMEKAEQVEDVLKESEEDLRAKIEGEEG